MSLLLGGKGRELGSWFASTLLDVRAYCGEVLLLLRYVLLEALGLGRRPRPLQPERLQVQRR